MCRLWSNFKLGENRAEQVGASCVRKRRLSPNLLRFLIFRDLCNIHGAPTSKITEIIPAHSKLSRLLRKNSLHGYDTVKKYVSLPNWWQYKFLVCCHFNCPRILLCSNCNIPVETIICLHLKSCNVAFCHTSGKVVVLNTILSVPMSWDGAKICLIGVMGYNLNVTIWWLGYAHLVISYVSWVLNEICPELLQYPDMFNCRVPE